MGLPDSSKDRKVDWKEEEEEEEGDGRNGNAGQDKDAMRKVVHGMNDVAVLCTYSCAREGVRTR